jgi:hypothetical protein
LGYGDDVEFSAAAGEYSMIDYASEMVASAVWPSMESVTVASQWAVRGQVEARLFGDGNDSCAWSICGERLIELIRSAPRERLLSISLDKLLSALNLSIVGGAGAS